VRIFARLLVLLAAASTASLGAQPPPAELQPLRVTGPPSCDDSSETDAVVCGRRPGERYRIAPELRADRTNPVNPSWAARARDEREIARFDGQAVGLTGIYRRSQEIECRWRAERQQIAGHPPDCTRRVRSPGD